MFFLRKNWKGLFFPISCFCIFFFDYFVGNSFYFTLIKILIFSLLHALYVYKTEYVYDSDIYRYLSDLKFEYERNHIIKPFLTYNQVNMVYICLVITLCFRPFESFSLISFSFFCALLIMDSLNIFLRSLTNKAELKNVKPPISLMQTRFVFTTLTKLIPHCTAASRFVIGMGGTTEIAYPLILGDGNSIGPATKLIGNNILYTDVKVPVETKLDSMYESFKHQDLIRPEGEPLLPERICNLRKEQDLLDLGVSQGDIDSMLGKNIPSLTNIRK